MFMVRACDCCWDCCCICCVWCCCMDADCDDGGVRVCCPVGLIFDVDPDAVLLPAQSLAGALLVAIAPMPRWW